MELNLDRLNSLRFADFQEIQPSKSGSVGVVEGLFSGASSENPAKANLFSLSRLSSILSPLYASSK